MNFVHRPEGMAFLDDKPAKLRFCVSSLDIYVDDLAPALESGSNPGESLLSSFKIH